MIVDEVIWEIINNGHCSFKTKTVENTFCKNEHNVTGLCNRNSCPLANSRYATVQEDKGVCYLFIKTVERSHTPRDLWEKIKLDASYNTALDQITENLKFFPAFLIDKCKQRFTRYRQVLVKKRKMRLQDDGVYEVVNRKATKREKSRGKKAEKAALIENHIEQELMSRLKDGKYDEIYNINSKLFEKIVADGETIEDKNEFDETFNEADYDNIFVSDLNKEEMLLETTRDETDDGLKEKRRKNKKRKNSEVSDISKNSDFDMSGFNDDADIEDIGGKNSKNNKGDKNKKDFLKKKRKNKIMYEYENEEPAKEKQVMYN
jgi:protein MAK16